jgi:hypothetical protein
MSSGFVDDQFLTLALREVANMPYLQRVLTNLSANMQTTILNQSALSEIVGLEPAGVVVQQKNALDTSQIDLTDTSGTDGTSNAHTHSFYSQTNNSIGPTRSPSARIVGDTSVQVSNVQDAQMIADRAVVKDGVSKRSELEAIKKELQLLEGMVKDAYVQLRSLAVFPIKALDNEVAQARLSLNATRIVVRRRVEWKKMSVVKLFGFVHPSFVTGYKDAESAMLELHLASVNGEDTNVGRLKDIKSHLSTDHDSFEGGIDDYTVDSVYDRRHTPTREDYWSVLDNTTFDDPDGTYGTPINTDVGGNLFDQNEIYTEAFTFPDSGLSDFDVVLKGSQITSQLVKWAMTIASVALLATGVPELIGGLALGSVALEKVGKIAAKAVAKSLLTQLSKTATSLVTHQSKSGGSIRGQIQTETSEGTMTVSLGYPEGKSPWAIEPVFVTEDDDGNGVNNIVYGQPLVMVQLSKAETVAIGSVFLLGGVVAADVASISWEEFWVPIITTQVGTSDFDTDGNQMQDDVTIQLHIGRATTISANVIKVNGIPIAGKEGDRWRLYTHNGSVVTLNGNYL